MSVDLAMSESVLNLAFEFKKLLLDPLVVVRRAVFLDEGWVWEGI